MSKRNRRAGFSQSALNRKRDKQDRLQILADAVDRRNWMIQALEARMMLSATPQGVPVWTQLGPAAMRGGQSLTTSPDPLAAPNAISGAVTSIVIDRSVPSGKTVLVGTANGGIWKTLDASVDRPHWVPETDQFVSLAISSLVQSPQDANVIYAGTGPISSGFRRPELAHGVYKSQDGGNTWSTLGDSFGQLRGQEIRQLSVSTGPSGGSEVVFAAAFQNSGRDGGLFRSQDGGKTWKLLSVGSAGTNSTGLPLGGVSSIVEAKDAPGVMFAAAAGDYDTNKNGVVDAGELDPADKGVYRSDDRGNTWARVNSGIATAVNSSRIVLTAAASPVAGISIPFVFATTIDLSEKLSGIFKSFSGAGVPGMLFVALPSPPATLLPAQGDIHFSMGVDPQDTSVVYIGGTISSPLFDGNTMRLDPATATWQSVVNAAANNSGPHADSRAMIFDSAGNLIEADDGGIYRLSNPSQPTRLWKSMIGDLGNTEVSHVAYDSTFDAVSFGNQDTGSSRFVIGSTGPFVADQLLEFDDGTTKVSLQGDGNWEATDSRNPAQTFTYAMANNFKTFFQFAYNGSGQVDLLPAANDPNLARHLNLRASPGAAQFSGLNGLDLAVKFESIPMVLNRAITNPALPGSMALGRHALYITQGLPGTIGDVVSTILVPAADGARINDLMYGGFQPDPTNPGGTQAVPNAMYVARGANVLVNAPVNPANLLGAAASTGAAFNFVDRTPHMDDDPAKTRLTNGLVRGIAVDPADWRHAFIVDFEQVFETTDAGLHWTPLVMIPGAPTLESIEVVPNPNTGRMTIIVGTVNGVFAANETGANNLHWHELGIGVPSIIVTDILYNKTDDRLLMATAGRGIWSLTGAGNPASPNFVGATPTLVVTGDELGARDDRFVIRRNPANPLSLQVFINPALTDLTNVTPTLSIPIAAVDQIDVSGGEGNDTLVVDSSAGVLDLRDGIHFHGEAGLHNRLELVNPGELKSDTTSIKGERTLITHKIDDQRVIVDKVDSNIGGLPTAPPPAVNLLGDGLNVLASIFGPGGAGQALSLLQPGLGNSLGFSLTAPFEPPPFSDGGGGNGTAEEDDDGGNQGGDPIANNLLSRLIQEGPARLFFDSIMSGDFSPAEIRDRLDNADDTRGNVALTTTASGFVFDIHILGNLDGMANLQVSGLDGKLTMAGQMHINADVALHLIVGVDDRGFFVDPNTGDPTLTVTNVNTQGEVTGWGTLGLLGVEIHSGDFATAAGVGVSASLVGTGPSGTGLLRADNFSGAKEPAALFTSQLFDTNAADDDYFLTADIEPSKLDEDLEPILPINGTIQVAFGNSADPGQISVMGEDEGGSDALSFLNITAQQVADGFSQLSQTLGRLGGLSGLDTPLPGLGLSVSDVLNMQSKPVNFTPEQIGSVSPVEDDGVTNRFTVTLLDSDPRRAGIAAGDTVFYAGLNNQLFGAVVEDVLPNALVISFASGAAQVPDAVTPRLEVNRKSGLADQLRAAMGDLAGVNGMDLSSTSLQGLTADLAVLAGVDFDGVSVTTTGEGDERIVQVAIDFDAAQLDYSIETNPVFGDAAPGLSLLQTPSFLVSILPHFHLAFGVRLDPALTPDARFFVVDDGQPVVTLNVSSGIDNVQSPGVDGLLGVNFGEDSSVANNRGLSFTGTFGIKLRDPGTDGADQMLSLAELSNTAPDQLATTSVDGNYNIDGVIIQSMGGISGSPDARRISINGQTAGHITSAADLVAVNNRLTVSGGASLPDFSTVDPSSLLGVLKSLGTWFSDLSKSAVLNLDVKFTNDIKLGAKLDFGAVFKSLVTSQLDRLRARGFNPGPADGKLAADLTFAIRINDGADISVSLPRASTLDNASLDDLTSDVRAAVLSALKNTPFAAAVDVSRQGLRLAFTAQNGGPVRSLEIKNAISLGFTDVQDAVATNFDTFQDLIDLVPALSSFGYDAATHLLRFDLSFDQALADANAPLSFLDNLGGLSNIQASGDVKLAARVNATLHLALDLTPLGQGFNLTSTTLLATLNAGAGVSPAPGADVVFNLRDGSIIQVDLDGLTTVQDVINRVLAQTSGKVLIGFNPATRALKVTDTTSGDATFSIAPIGSSLAATSAAGLGIVGVDDNSDGVIIGAPLHGQTLADRFFINGSIGGSLDLTGNVNATAKFGFAGVKIVNGKGLAHTSVTLPLADPGTSAADGRIYLKELVAGLSDPSTLVPSPVIKTTANFDLPIQLDPALPGNGAGDPHVTMTWSDLADPSTLKVAFNGDMQPFAGLSGLGLSQIVNGLRGLQTFYTGLESLPGLTTPIPGVGKSFQDLLGVSGSFKDMVDRLAAANPGNVQALQQALRDALKIGQGGDPASAANVTFTNGVLDLSLVVARTVNQTLPVSIDLSDLGAGLGKLAGGTATFSGSGKITVELIVEVSDPANPKISIKDSSANDYTARITGSGLSFNAAVGPLGVFIRNGTAVLDNGQAAPGPATFHVGLTPNSAGHLYGLDDLDPGLGVLSAVGHVKVTLLVFFPDVGSPLSAAKPNIVLNVGNLTDIANTTTLDGPDIASAIDLKLADLRDNVASLIEGWDGIFKFLQDSVKDKLASVKLPLVGSQLSDAVSFLTDLRDTVTAQLRALAAPTDVAVKQVFFNALGPAGLKWLGDLNNDGQITVADVGMVSDANNVQFNFKLHKSATLASTPVKFDLGLPVLSLDVDGGVNVMLGFDFAFGFGVNRTQGVYLDTSAVDELKISVAATIPGMVATGHLGFLQVEASDLASNPSNVTGTIAVDLKNPDNRLTLGELGGLLSQLLDARFTASAAINLHLRTTFSGSTVFPEIQADLHLNWPFANASLNGGAQFGGQPTVVFDNAKMSLGSFFSNFVKPILKYIRVVTGPLQPIIDLLEEPVPLISDLTGSTVTWLDMAETFGSSDVQMIAKIIRILNLINTIPVVGDNVYIDLGSFDLGAADLRNVGLDLLHSIPNILKKINVSVELPPEAAAYVAQLEEGGGSALQFPILQNPEIAFRLLLGQDVSLFTFKMPPLKVGFEFSIFIPTPIPILGVRLTGAIKAEADLSFGYDTFGLRELANNGFSDFSVLLDGFYISDRANADGTGPDVPEVTLTASFTVGAELNLYVASAGVEGGLYANIFLNLHDPNNDGKVRLAEVGDQLAQNPLCLFDTSGNLTVGLSAYLKVGIGPFSVTSRFDIASATLVDFDHTCPDGVPPPVLASVNNGVLTLNMGPLAGQRLYNNTVDGDEVFRVSKGDNPGDVVVTAFGFQQTYSGVTAILADGGNGNDAITIAPDVMVPVTLMGGAGDDALKAGGGPATLRGGDGNDHLTGGASGDQIYGDDGDDFIQGRDGTDLIEGGLGRDVIDGGTGNDTLRGQAGEDILHGGTGNDFIEGGDDNDQIFGDSGNDTLHGDAGNDNIDGGADADLIAGGVGDDSIVGGTGNDTITADAGRDSVDGGAGDDSISGGDDADSLMGGLGNDSIDGGAGNDSIYGNGGGDTITGGTGDDLIFAEDDQTGGVGSGPHSIDGGTGNDTIYGSAGPDVIHGGDGNDSIRSFAGADMLFGDAGNDFMDAGAGTDVLDGGAGDDSLSGGAGSDTIYGGDGNDQITAGDTSVTAGSSSDRHYIDAGEGNNFVSGDAGADTILSGSGNDTIYSNGGDDLISAGNGANVVYAAAGNDTVTTGSGADLIDLGDGNDIANAGDGNNTVRGQAGNDTVTTGSGADLIDLGSGDDSASSGAGNDRITGGTGADTVNAGDGADRIDGNEGDDVLNGQGGDDLIFGGDGNDIIAGGDGNDSIFGDAGRDILWGGAAALNSTQINPANAALFVNPPQFDAAEAKYPTGYVPPKITPAAVNGRSLPGTFTDGRDLIQGGDDGDWLFGGGDMDNLDGGAGNDYVDAGSGNDTATGNSGDDVVMGGDNDDLVLGGIGIDQVYGDEGLDDGFGHGNDSLFGDAGNGAVQAGQRLWGGGGLDSLHAYAPTNLASEFALIGDELHGGAGNDSVYGNIRREVLIGDDGDDNIIGDFYIGPDYALNTNSATFGAADTLLGGFGQDVLQGGGGADLMWGGGDPDFIEGQDGHDTAYGGAGIDLIVLDTDRAYMQLGDTFDGHYGNESKGDVPDDFATDILLIRGTQFNDNISLGQTPTGDLSIDFAAKLPSGDPVYSFNFTTPWRDSAGNPVIEQFRITTFEGDDTVTFKQGTDALRLDDLNSRGRDFVSEIDSGPGNDTVFGSPGRDRIDGQEGNDVLYGLGGDDRLYGSDGADYLYGGQGDDDLLGGNGENHLYAWSQDPSLGAQFGIFIDTNGGLHDDNGDLDNDGHLDSDPTQKPYALEDTGLDRMLGGDDADSLYGGTGVDFLYGAGGDNTLYKSDGTRFEDADGGLAGDEWKSYAKASDKVWYVSGTNADDQIHVDYVTEPGLLVNHHVVTRLTNNNGNFSFSLQVRLDFDARDASGSLIWDPSDVLLNLASAGSLDPAARRAAYDQVVLTGGLLPSEGDYLVIVIDALGGNDDIEVGPTVQKTVWIDGGAGNDKVQIFAGNAILIDKTEDKTRNDTPGTAAQLSTAGGTIGRSTSFGGLTIDNPNDVDWYKFRLAQGSPEGTLRLGSASSTDGLVMRVYATDSSGAATGSPLSLVTTSAVDGPDAAGAGGAGGNDTRANAYKINSLGDYQKVSGLTLDHPGDVDWYGLTLENDHAATLTATAAAPATGRLDRNAQAVFALSVANAAAVTVTLNDDSTNHNLADLIADINVALSNAGIGGSVIAASLSDGRITLALRNPLAGQTLVVTSANQGAIDILRLPLGSSSASATATGGAAGPADGRVARPATFAMQIDNSAIITVSLQDDPTNVGIADLVRDINDALAAAGLADAVIAAAQADGKITLSLRDATAGHTLTIAQANATTNTFLHLPVNQTASATMLSGGSISLDPVDAALSVSFELYNAQGNLVATSVVDGTKLRIDFAGLAAGNYFIRVTGVATPGGDVVGAYNLLPSFGARGTLRLNLAGTGSASVSLAGLDPSKTYLVQVTSPNLVPTIYHLDFVLNPTDAANLPVVDQSTRSGAGASDGSDRRDVILGGTGNDTLIGGAGEDWIFGGDGNDVLSGGPDHQASDLLFGEAGDDTFQIFTDRLPYLNGTTQTYLPTLSDEFYGGTGNDRVLYQGTDSPDFVAYRYVNILHRYEITDYIWDSANNRFMPNASGTGNERRYAYFQAHDIEHMVFDMGGDNDEVHADANYKIDGESWGIGSGMLQQGATLAGVEIRGGAGSDRLFGGNEADSIDGGEGDDFLYGGPGDDTITGGGGRDMIAGNDDIRPDAYETVTRYGSFGNNDQPTFAALLPKPAPGLDIAGLTFHTGDQADWYIVPVPTATNALGVSQSAQLTRDMIDVHFNDPTADALFHLPANAAINYFLYAASATNPSQPLALTPIERFSGIPQYYLLKIVNLAGVVAQGTYTLHFHGPADAAPRVGDTIHVGPTSASFTTDTGDASFQPITIPLGDINGDGYADFIAAVHDSPGTVLDQQFANGRHPAMLLPPSDARIVFGGPAPANSVLDATGLTLRLPAPLQAPSYWQAQSVITHGDFNHDGYADIAVAVSIGVGNGAGGVSSAMYDNAGVYLIFGRADLSGLVDVVRDADVVLNGFNGPLDVSNAGDVNSDGIDDLLIGATGPSPLLGKAYLYYGRADWNTPTLVSADFDDASGNASNDGLSFNNSTAPDVNGLWHATDSLGSVIGHGGGHSAYFGQGETATTSGNYGGNLRRAGEIDTDALSFVGLTSPVLSFNYRLATEVDPQFDKAKVQYTLDGNTWIDLASNPTGLLDRAGWAHTTISLTALTGKSEVHLRFFFDTGDSALNDFEGWYVDDVVIRNVIKPAAANVTITRSAGSGDGLGAGVAGIGDFNGDGIADFAVLSEQVGAGLNGKVSIFYGRNTNFPATLNPDTNANVVITTNLNLVGRTVRAIGNVDGDFNGDPSRPLNDLLITQQDVNPNFSSSNDTIVTGRTSSAPINLTLASTGIVAGNLLPLGDINGDGYADLGRPLIRFDQKVDQSGVNVAHLVDAVYLGSASGPNLSQPNLEMESAFDVLIQRFNPYLFSTAGDINADGFSDLGLGDLIGTKLRMYLGAPIGDPAADPPPPPPATPTPVTPVIAPSSGTTSNGTVPGLNLSIPGQTNLVNSPYLEGSLTNEQLSRAMSVGDLNGDGATDFLLQGSTFDYVVFGPLKLNRREGATSVALLKIDASIGKPALRMGDIDGDGFNDLIFLTINSTTSTTVKIMSLRKGTATDIDYSFSVVFEISAADQVMALNWNGDRFADLLYVRAVPGASGYVGHVIGGDKIVAGQVGTSPQSNALANFSIDNTPSGTRSLIAQSFLGSVIPANLNQTRNDNLAIIPGDVNGDGLDDILFYNPHFIYDSGQAPDLGRAYLFSDHSFTTGSLTNANVRYQALDLAGAAPVGDLNNDGYSDVALVTSAENGTNLQGSALFIYGKASPFGYFGIGAQNTFGVPSPLKPDLILRRVAPVSLTGGTYYSGALQLTSGDFNGDGKTDLAVGETERTLLSATGLPLDSNQSGTVSIFWNVANGPNDRLINSADVTLTGGADHDKLGTLPLTPGMDLDGDRIDDLLAGASLSDANQSAFAPDAGRIYFLYGHPQQYAPGLPPPSQVNIVTNVSIPGDGEFLNTKGPGQPEVRVQGPFLPEARLTPGTNSPPSATARATIRSASPATMKPSET